MQLTLTLLYGVVVACAATTSAIAADPADVAKYASEAYTAENTEVMMRMHHAMSIDPSGDADTDFVASMIPHHRGAVDMAKIELKYGKDPELQTLARNIIAAQENEMVIMRAWQNKHGHTARQTHTQ